MTGKKVAQVCRRQQKGKPGAGPGFVQGFLVMKVSLTCAEASDATTFHTHFQYPEKEKPANHWRA